MKSKIFSIMLSIFLLLPVSVLAVESIEFEPADLTYSEQTENNQMLDEDNNIDEDILPAKDNLISPYKQPISKKKIVKKFLLAMMGVMVSSLLLYFGLSVYNRVRGGFVNKVKTSDGENSLQTPDDLESAVKSFLDNTRLR